MRCKMQMDALPLYRRESCPPGVRSRTRNPRPEVAGGDPATHMFIQHLAAENQDKYVEC